MNLGPAGGCRRTGKTIRTPERPSTFFNGNKDYIQPIAVAPTSYYIALERISARFRHFPQN